MTQTGYSNAIVNVMLGWLKGFAGWVLKLFNLSAGFSPLKFIANHWLKLLIVLLIAGVAIDLLVWLIRWRPHWVWFRKKRVIINDKNFFAREKYIDDAGEWDMTPPKRPAKPRPSTYVPPAKPRRNWEENEFVVPSEARRRREEQANRRAAYVKSMQLKRQQNAESTDVFRDGLFNVNAKQKFSDKYEDEVFSVNNLPMPEKRPQPKPAVRRDAPRSAVRSRGGNPAKKR